MVQSPMKKALERSGEGRSGGDEPNGVKDGTGGRFEPGKVEWHASFQDACNAARQSGKPVLLFQLLGRLDEEFC